MLPDEVLDKVRAKFSDAFIAESTALQHALLVVKPDKWMAVAKWLATDGGFKFLSDLTACDWLDRDPRFDVVYTVTNMSERARLTVKLPVAYADKPQTPSVTGIWPSADWPEREVYDMFGIEFTGHPNLARILMPDEWEGHPLRKDYAVGKVPVEYKRLSPGSAL